MKLKNAKGFSQGDSLSGGQFGTFRALLSRPVAFVPYAAIHTISNCSDCLWRAMLSSTSRVSELVVCYVDIVCVLMVGPAEHIQQRQRIRGEGVRAGLGCGGRRLFSCYY